MGPGPRGFSCWGLGACPRPAETPQRRWTLAFTVGDAAAVLVGAEPKATRRNGKGGTHLAPPDRGLPRGLLPMARHGATGHGRTSGFASTSPTARVPHLATAQQPQQPGERALAPGPGARRLGSLAVPGRSCDPTATRGTSGRGQAAPGCRGHLDGIGSALVAKPPLA